MQKVLAWVVLFVALYGGASHAQQREMRVGRLMTWANGPFSELTNRSFERGLREAGFVEGKNLVLLRRSANGDSSQFPALARDLARQDVRVIFAPSKPMADAAKDVFRLSGNGRHVILQRTHHGKGVLYLDAADATFAEAMQKKFASDAK